MSDTPSSPPSGPKLAPHHLRLFALILDYLLVTTLLKLADQALLGEHWDLLPASADEPVAAPGWIAWLVFLLLAKDAAGGRSPGKWLGGIAVVRADDPTTRAPLHKCLLRNLTLPLLPLEGIVLFFDPYLRRLGDRLAGTVVVIPASPLPLRLRLMGMAVLVLAVLLASFLMAPWNMRRSAAYQTAYTIAANHPAVREAVGAPVRLDSAPTFQLDLKPEGSRATLIFQAEGPKGETGVRVRLRLGTAPRAWREEAVTVGTAGRESLIQKAPTRQGQATPPGK